MPTNSRFYGITIRMYYEEAGPACFHAYYDRFVAVLDLRTLRVADGWVPRRAMGLIRFWARGLPDEMEANWRAVAEHHPPGKLAGLE